jgi:hypothetical protein
VSAADPATLQAAIHASLARLDMQVVGQDAQGLVVQWGQQGRWFRFRIALGPTGYTAELIDSDGMRQQVEPRTGNVVIHGRYHSLIDKLHQLVARNLGSAGVATAGGAVASGGAVRVIRTDDVIDVGILQRGFLVAGSEVDQVSEDAGLVTTAPTDTGFRYGFIDGEGATLFVSYTGTVYPAEVRITQRVQRCSRVYVQVGVGLAQQLRCEPFDGSAPGSVAQRLDELAAVVEREVRAMAPLPADRTVIMQPAQPAQPAAQPSAELM